MSEPEVKEESAQVNVQESVVAEVKALVLLYLSLSPHNYYTELGCSPTYLDFRRLRTQLQTSSICPRGVLSMLREKRGPWPLCASVF
jgi:hypothetical protein